MHYRYLNGMVDRIHLIAAPPEPLHISAELISYDTISNGPRQFFHVGRISQAHAEATVLAKLNGACPKPAYLNFAHSEAEKRQRATGPHAVKSLRPRQAKLASFGLLCQE